jgi:hypothetical protein
MNTGVCITCGAADVDLNDATEQCADCDKEETGGEEPKDEAEEAAE